MKKVLAVLLAGMFVLGFGVGCGGEQDPKELSKEGWYNAFKYAAESLCATNYTLIDDFIWFEDAKLPNDTNCKVTITGADGKMMSQVIVAEGKAFIEVYAGKNFEDIPEDEHPILYLQNTEDGKIHCYLRGMGDDWGTLTVDDARDWSSSFLFAATEPLNYLLSMGLWTKYVPEDPMNAARSDFRSFFEYSEQKGGWVTKMDDIVEAATDGLLDGEVVYKIKGEKLSEIVLTGICPELGMNGIGSVVTYSFVYGGQNADVPPEVIEAANQQQSAKTDYTDEEWFEIFKFAATSMCDVDYAAGDPSSPYGWASLGSIPNDKNCRVTLTGPNGNLLAQVIVAEGKAYAEQYPGDGDDEDRPRLYLQNAGEGLMTGYQSGLGEGWGPVSIPAEEFARCESYGCVYGTEFLLTVGQLGNGLRAPDGKEYPSYREFFEYSEQKGGWVSKSEAAVALATNGMLDGEVVFYIKGGKLTQIVLTGICPELMLETPGSIVYTFTYGGQNADVPPEVIEAANQ